MVIEVLILQEKSLGMQNKFQVKLISKLKQMRFKPFTISFGMKIGFKADLFGNGFTTTIKLGVKKTIDLLLRISQQNHYLKTFTKRTCDIFNYSFVLTDIFLDVQNSLGIFHHFQTPVQCLSRQMEYNWS